MRGPIEEIRVAERYVARASGGGDETADVLEHHVLRHDKEAAVVHRWDGAVQAMMETAAARLDVPRYDLGAVAAKSGVARQRRQGISARHRERLFARGVRRVGWCASSFGVLNERDEVLLELAAEH